MRKWSQSALLILATIFLELRSERGKRVGGEIARRLGLSPATVRATRWWLRRIGVWNIIEENKGAGHISENLEKKIIAEVLEHLYGAKVAYGVKTAKKKVKKSKKSKKVKAGTLFYALRTSGAGSMERESA